MHIFAYYCINLHILFLAINFKIAPRGTILIINPIPIIIIIVYIISDNHFFIIEVRFFSFRHRELKRFMPSGGNVERGDPGKELAQRAPLFNN